MKKLLFFLFFLPFSGFSQGSYKFFVFFKDKNNSPYSFSQPLDFLSQRALDRRTRQNISLDSLDLPVNPQYLNGIRTLGIPVYAVSKWFNGAVIYCDSTALTQVLSLPYVQTAKKVTRTGSRLPSKFEEITPSVERHGVTSSASTIDYGAGANQAQMIKIDVLHDLGFTGNGMLIAMLDAGFNNADQVSFFQSLFSRNGVVATWDFVDNQSGVYEDDSHGEMCMSTIAANLPGQMVGTAPDASFILLRTEDVFSENIVEEYNWAAGAEYADSAGADIISSSLGYTEFDDWTSNHIYADMNGHTCPSSVAANVAARKGILPVISAGNQGQQAWHFISAPGDADSALTAGAVDFSGSYAPFSSYGPASDGAVKPNVMTQGQDASVVDPSNAVFGANGTSFSCPILAGAAACLWQHFPDRSSMEIKSAIEKSAHLYLTPNDSMGYGIPNFEAASFLLSVNSPGNQSDQFMVYPNPFIDRLFVNVFSRTAASVTMEVLSLNGALITNDQMNIVPGTINSLEISLPEELSSGVYFIKVITPEKSQTFKVIK